MPWPLYPQERTSVPIETLKKTEVKTTLTPNLISQNSDMLGRIKIMSK
jgi:hypothetical protein